MTLAFRAASTGAHEELETLQSSPYTVATTDSITVDASDTVIVVAVTFGSPGQSGTQTGSVQSVTIGGTSCTAWSGSKVWGDGNTDQDGFTELWTLTAPASSPGTGAKTIQVTVAWTGGGTRKTDVCIAAGAYTGTLDASPFGTPVTDNLSLVSSMTASVPSMATGDLAIGVCVNGSSAPGVTTGTLDKQLTGDGFTGGSNLCLAHNTGTGSVSIVWSTNSGDESAYTAARLIAGASSPTGTVAVTLQNFTSSASGQVDNPVTGTVAVTLANCTAAIAGSVVNTQVGYIKEVGFVTNTSAGTTSAITVAAGGVQVGDTIVIYGACDNTGSAGAATTISVADNSSQSGAANTYTLQTPQALADPGAASAGQQGFLVVCVVTRALLANDTITITYGNSTTAKAINAQQFAGVNIATPVLAGQYAHTDNESSTTATVTTTPSKAGQAVCALVAVEGGTADSFTEDSDTTNGSWVTLTRRGSGTTTSGSTLNSVYKLVTASGAQTYNPTLGTARDHCDAALTLSWQDTATGTVAVTLQNATAAASGTVTMTGTVAVTLQDATASASGSVTGAGNVSGTVAVTLQNFTAAASGTETMTGTVAVTLAGFTSTATGTETISGTVAVTLQNFICHATNITGFFVATASSNGHYLKDQDGNPIFVYGTSPQNAVPNGTLSEIDTYFSSMQDQGVNAVQMHLVYNFEADAETSTTPFASNSTLDTTGHTAYWGTIDSIFTKAETYGITIFATILDNITCGTQVESVSDTNCFAYGQFLGNRYKTRANLVWVVGNDFDTTQYSARRGKYQQMVDGIRDQSDTHLLTVWLNTNPSDSDTNWDSRISIDNGYAYDTAPYNQATPAYDLTRTGYPKPFVWFEGTYYGEHNASAGSSSNLELRKLAWWTITAGGVGHFFGTNKTWQFDTSGTGWSAELSGGAAAIYAHLKLIPTLFASADLTGWQNLVPDESHVFQTGGRGSDGSLDSSTLATAAFINGGKVGLVYFPSSRGSITFDTTKLSGTVSAYWWDPTDASTSTESNPAAPTHPGNNTGGDGDWVLVFTGTDAFTGTVAVTLQNATSSASGTVANPVSGTVAVTLASYAASAAGTETISGTVAVTLAGFASTASGTVANPVTGTSTTTLQDFTSTASGTETISGSVAVTLQAATTTTTAAVANPVTGTVAVTLQNATSQVAAVETISGTVAQTLQSVTASADGSVANPVTGTVAVTLHNFTVSALGTQGDATFGIVDATLQDFTMAATGSVSITGTVAVTLQNVTPFITGSETITGTVAAQLQNAAASIAGVETISGSVAQTLQDFTASATGTSVSDGSVAVVLENYIGHATGIVANPVSGTVAVTLDTLVVSASGFMTGFNTGSVAVTLQPFISLASGHVINLFVPPVAGIAPSGDLRDITPGRFGDLTMLP